ncbi:MAG: cation acetate symporter [Actinomycetales bacterium]|nr:cation acetate symporter [Actinomycetales bacterium]
MTESWWPVLAVIAVVVVTFVIGTFGVRVSRTTSDFLVASRSVTPLVNASAISGEYLSAASFLGIAGLVLTYGVDMLWFPVGYTVGYLVLLVLVAAPLRRSGAYTLPDFAEMRLGSQRLRLIASVLVVLIGWLYLLPQFQGAGITLHALTGAPSWVGAVVVAVVVGVTVATGGMRSITSVQAFQYWLKLAAISIPAVLLVGAWFRHGAPVFAAGDWGTPLSGYGGRDYPVYKTYSIVLATFLGTMGLPHVLVRFYTNPDGRATRRTTLVVLGLLSAFYVFPPVFGALGRVYTPELAGTPAADTVVLLLPGRVFGGWWGEALSSLVAAGAFAAFLSTASGLSVSIAGVLSHDLLGRTRRFGDGVRRFRIGTLVAVVVPFLLALVAGQLDLAQTVTLAFAVAASTFCPLLVLGIWWPRLTVRGASAALVVGGGSALGAVALVLAAGPFTGFVGALLDQPAAWTVPLAFGTAVVVSLRTRDRVPRATSAAMVRLHAPDELDLRR